MVISGKRLSEVLRADFHPSRIDFKVAGLCRSDPKVYPWGLRLGEVWGLVAPVLKPLPLYSLADGLRRVDIFGCVAPEEAEPAGGGFAGTLKEFVERFQSAAERVDFLNDQRFADGEAFEGFDRFVGNVRKGP